ncbi:hypothetical protein [Mycobacterium florentinum]|uniref:hypothetical protein n=1 Tax=Mycobacterium florentinum TaxID=292462 RepID=UPI0013D6A380|nr:hypothetical protein [Mycobacterium florentinum]
MFTDDGFRAARRPIRTSGNDQPNGIAAGGLAGPAAAFGRPGLVAWTTIDMLCPGHRR